MYAGRPMYPELLQLLHLESGYAGAYAGRDHFYGYAGAYAGANAGGKMSKCKNVKM